MCSEPGRRWGEDAFRCSVGVVVKTRFISFSSVSRPRVVVQVRMGGVSSAQVNQTSRKETSVLTIILLTVPSSTTCVATIALARRAQNVAAIAPIIPCIHSSAFVHPSIHPSIYVPVPRFLAFRLGESMGKRGEKKKVWMEGRAYLRGLL